MGDTGVVTGVGRLQVGHVQLAVLGPDTACFQYGLLQRVFPSERRKQANKYNSSL